MKIAYLAALSRARRDEDRDPSRRILAAIRAGEAPASFRCTAPRSPQEGDISSELLIDSASLVRGIPGTCRRIHAMDAHGARLVRGLARVWIERREGEPIHRRVMHGQEDLPGLYGVGRE